MLTAFVNRTGVVFVKPQGISTLFFAYESGGELLAVDQKDSTFSLLHYQLENFVTVLCRRHILSHAKLSQVDLL